MALKTLKRSLVAERETSQQTAQQQVVAALGAPGRFGDIDTAHRGAIPRGFQQTKRHYLKIRAQHSRI